MSNINIFTSETGLPPHFVAAKRLNAVEFDSRTLSYYIRVHCEQNGQPLVVSNIDQLKKWDDLTLSLDHLKQYRGDIDVSVQRENQQSIKLSQFIDALKHKYNMGDDMIPHESIDIEHIYAKDISCPVEFKDAMHEALPQYLLPHGYSDLFSLLPERFQAENLMCYIGQSDTGTPIHRDLCGTMGHNIMTTSSEGAFAEWYIITNEYRDELASAILEPTSQDKKIHLIESIDADGSQEHRSSTGKSSFIESDRAWLDHRKLEGRDITVQVVIQKKGDLVIVPSRAYHQVRNSGMSVKIAWNRVTADTLHCAFQDQIPLYRIINRPEVYKCKAIISFTIREWYSQLLDTDRILNIKFGEPFELPSSFRSGIEEFVRNSKTLLNLYLNIVIAPELLQDTQNITTDGPGEVCTIVCDFCHTDIFHRYYHCKTCDEYDICLDCYAMGRSCKHIADMKMHQSPDDIMDHVAIYQNYVAELNEKFGAKMGFVEPGLEEKLLNVEPKHASNLATTCRRIEQYRNLKKFSFNTLVCGHCSKRTTVSKLAEQGYDLSSVFSRDVCSSLPPVEYPERIRKIYSCESCSKECKSCSPLVPKTKDVYNLVYYLHPAHDPRNYGGYKDVNMRRTCEFPKHRSVEKTPAVSANDRNLRKRKQIDYREMAGLSVKKQKKDEDVAPAGEEGRDVAPAIEEALGEDKVEEESPPKTINKREQEAGEFPTKKKRKRTDDDDDEYIDPPPPKPRKRKQKV